MPIKVANHLPNLLQLPLLQIHPSHLLLDLLKQLGSQTLALPITSPLILITFQTVPPTPIPNKSSLAMVNNSLSPILVMLNFTLLLICSTLRNSCMFRQCLLICYLSIVFAVTIIVHFILMPISFVFRIVLRENLFTQDSVKMVFTLFMVIPSAASILESVQSCCS